MKNILTATDLDNNNKEINRVIEERVIQFNKNRIRKALKEAKDLKRIELNDDSFTLSKEESEQLKLKIINDSLTEKFRENEKINLLSEKENYLNLRKNVEGLNQLGWDSIHIEKVGIQNHLDYIKFEDLLSKSTSYSQHFLSLRDKHLLTINEEIKQIPSDDEADLKSLEIILKLREMYEVTTDTDDFEIFKRFGTDNNTDTAFELSNIFLSKSNHSVNDNIVNNLMRKVRVGDVKTMESLTSLVKDDIITNRMLGILFSNKYITNNEVTTFDNMFGTNIGMKYVYRTRTLGELFLEITNSEISQVSKANRQQIYMTYDGTRPEKDSYHKWNGLQVYDLDLKLWIKKSGGDLALLKEELHKYLSSFHWYLWICTSASGKGLHIYTKVTPPHHIYTNIIENEKLCKYWHQVNYLQKQSVIYDILHRLHNISGNGIIFTDFWKEEKGVEVLYQNNVKQNRYLDNIVSRITAGIRLSYDEKPFINYNFVDCHPGWLMGQTVDGYEYPETIENVFIQQPNNIRRRIDEDIIDEESKHKQQLDLSKYVTLGGDLTNVKPIHKSGINYAVRYNVCNTLASLFGKDGLPIAHMVLDSKGCNNVDEINSFYGCALSNGKEPSKLGLEVLKKSGIIKAVEEPLIKEVDTSFKGQIKDQIEKSIENQDTLYHVKLGDGFLSDHNDYLTEHITGSKINIILAPPGAGKCLGYGTKIIMFDGTKKEVQDIKVGDLLMGPDSTPRKVLSLARGREEMFNVIQNRGENFVCNKSHIMSLIESGVWNDYKYGKTPDFNKVEDIDVTGIQNLSKNHRKKMFKVPLNFDKKEVSIDPYWLGLWLGDGSKRDASIAVGSFNNEPIAEYIENYANELGGKFSRTYDARGNNVSVCRIYFDNVRNNKLMDMLRSYDVLNNKHIPSEYLINDRETRLKLFAGIIDSDGGGDASKCTYDLVTKLDSLKDGYEFLARSLGYYVNTKIKVVNGVNYWRLLISGDFSDLPVRLPRKVMTRNINKNPLVTGFKLESIGEGDYYGFEIDGDRRFLLGDFTVTHNTSWIKHLAKAGKKVMLVLPYVSVIRNKIETDDEISKLFDNYYGSKDLKEMEYGRNIVTTFDKFSRCNHEKAVRMFDYIFIDESHLLFTSSYRIEATSNTIKRIKEIFFVSSNDPFSAKMVLMTGTETGESFYFKDVGNIINVSKKQKDKSMEFLICNDTLDAITRLSDKASKLIQEGYRLMIPTNKGEIYSEKIIGMIEYILQRPVKYGYYKRSNTEQEICRLIDEHNSIGDYEIIFCSNYLSVGVDINDNHLFASIYLGNFAGYEIEQFNARIRKTGIKAIYCLPTQTLDGKINEMLLDEPNLLLKITDEDKLFFIDDRSIAEAKTEFIATYDPVLKKITTPGFSLFNGKIQFNLEEYELISFENKYNDCMEHPLKIARELSNYGYDIKVSTEFEGLSLHEQEKLKQMGIESAKNEKIRKHNLLVGTYVDLIKHDTYTNEYGLEFTNVIEWIGKNADKIEEDRELVDDLSQPAFVNVIFDVFATPQKVLVRNKEAFDKMFRYAKYMTRRYSNVRAIDIIYQYVDPQGILKVKNFQRAVNLLKLIDNSDSNELSEPVSKTIEKIYIFVDKFEAHKDYRIGYETYQAVIDSWTHEYIDMLGIKVNTKYAWDKVRDALTEMLSDISTRQTSKNGIRFVYNKLPDQDSSEVLSRRSVDNIIASMFNVTESIMDKKQKVREKHITLQKQDF